MNASPSSNPAISLAVRVCMRLCKIFRLPVGGLKIKMGRLPEELNNMIVASDGSLYIGLVHPTPPVQWVCYFGSQPKKADSGPAKSGGKKPAKVTKNRPAKSRSRKPLAPSGITEE